MTRPAYLPTDVDVRRVHDLTPSLRRVTLTGPGLRDMAPLCLDRRIKLVLPQQPGDPIADLPRDERWYAAVCSLEPSSRPAVRTYTARAVRPQVAELDVDVVRHGTEGPAGRWIEHVEPGDGLLAVVPMADHPGIDAIGVAWRPGQARHVLIVADETAAPAAASIAESLPSHVGGHIVIEVPTSADVLPVRAPSGVDVQVLPRDGAPHGSLLGDAVRSIEWPPAGATTGDDDAPAGRAVGDAAADPLDGPPIWEEPPAGADGAHYAWLAGESGVVTQLRRHLVRERGCPRHRVAFMGYWRRGRPEA